jgi:hypothetical protein
LGGWRRRLALIGVFWQFLAKCRLEAQCFPIVVTGLNNQRSGESYYSEDEGSFGGLLGLNIRLIIFSGLISPKKGVFRIHDLMSIICIIILVISQVVIF